MGARKAIFSLCAFWLRGARHDPRDRVQLAELRTANDRLTTELRDLQRHLDLVEQRYEAELGVNSAAPGISVEISAGELIDKQTILEIKLERLTDASKRRNVATECEVISAAAAPLLQRNPQLQEMAAALKAVNAQIWDAEDEIRVHERTKKFDESFIALARSIHAANDRRAALKRRINESTGSRLLEEKSYPI